MHLFLTFEYILEIHNISRIAVFMCVIEGPGKLCSLTLHRLPSLFVLLAPSWPQRALVLELRERASPGELGGTLLSALLCILSLSRHCGERHCFLRHSSSYLFLLLPLLPPFPLSFFLPLFFYHA